MIYWIKKISRIIAFITFFIIFFCGIDPNDPFNIYNATSAFIKAFFGAILLWLTAFVICDIILKGAVEDVPKDEIEVLDGGIIQRLHETQNENKVIGRVEKNVNEEGKQKKKQAKKKIKEI
jgi:hypothetical protein